MMRIDRVAATLIALGLVVGAPASAGRDSDGDGMPNRWEVRHGLNPDRPNAKADPDCDGLSNRREYRERLHPKRRDVDHDGLADGEEVKVFNTDARNPDTDADGIPDGNEDTDTNGIFDEDEADPTVCRLRFLDRDRNGIEQEDEDDIDAPGVLVRAMAGPTCPVQKQNDPTCNDRPVEGAEITVEQDGQTIATLHTAHDGMATINLEPGTYRFTPQPVEGLMGTPEPIDVEITEDAVAIAVFSYDTGIR